MASGIITLIKTAGAHLEGQIVWESVSNGTAANTSTVTANLQLRKANYASTQGEFYGSLTVGGVTESGYQWYDLGRTWQTIQTITTTVAHNNDGTGSCYLYGKLNGAGGTTTNSARLSGSGTVTLDTIARYAGIVSAPNFNDEENPTITYSNPAGNNIESLQACISLTGARSDISYRDISKTGTSYTFSLTEAERNVLRDACTDANSRTVIFFVRSTIGGNVAHSTLTRTLNIVNANPTITPSAHDSNSVTTALTGDSSKFVRYYSNAAVTFGAAALKGASIVSRKVTCGSKSLTADGTINAVESGAFAFAVTDSRGNQATQILENDLISYVKLSCNLSNNIPNTAGQLEVSVSGNCFNGSFGAQENTLAVYYRWKERGGTYSGWTAMTTDQSGDTYTAAASLTGLDYQKSYVVQAYAADKLETAYSAEKTVRATPVFDWSKDNFRFNVPVTFADGKTITSPAPSGYGLGAKSVLADDLNNITANGWYTGSTNSPDGENWMVEHIQYGYMADTGVQNAYRGYNIPSAARRFKFNGIWRDWEWENPPMYVGVEYPTTERYDGKTVYCKRIDCGTLPAGSIKSVAHGLGASTMVRCYGRINSGSTLPSFDGANHIMVFADASRVYVYCTRTDLITVKAYVTVYYTKS